MQKAPDIPTTYVHSNSKYWLIKSIQWLFFLKLVLHKWLASYRSSEIHMIKINILTTNAVQSVFTTNKLHAPSASHKTWQRMNKKKTGM